MDVNFITHSYVSIDYATLTLASISGETKRLPLTLIKMIMLWIIKEMARFYI